MGQPSYLVMALGVLNLLLAAAGLLLVYFDWGAARRREFLYLYFTSEEKPGANYFYAAKRRRAQFSRLLAAFAVLLLQQTVAVWIAVAVAEPGSYEHWLTWWQDGQTHPSISLAVWLYPWLYHLEILGLGLLAFGLLFPSSQDRSAAHDVLTAGFVGCWLLFALAASGGLFGEQTAAVERWVAIAVRTIVFGWVLWRLAGRSESIRAADGLLHAEPTSIVMAFGVWWIGHSLGDVLANPAGAPLGMILALAPIVLAIARGVLSEYETVESSRHRMGRERAVIFSFLQRIGAAFTTAVEVDAVLRIVAESALETTEASAGAIFLYHAERGVLEPRVVL
ncbi:MAG: hypothetical protein JWN98_1331, partial [Abditibacteriota bacterium]|nr:hypothetical protein [Abditibacteriota bacterium]